MSLLSTRLHPHQLSPHQTEQNTRTYKMPPNLPISSHTYPPNDTRHKSLSIGDEAAFEMDLWTVWEKRVRRTVGEDSEIDFDEAEGFGERGVDEGVSYLV